MKRTAWLWFLAITVAVSVGYCLLPVALWKEPLYDAIVTACVAAVLVAIIRRRPGRWDHWWFFLVGMASICAAEWYWFVSDVRGVTLFPSWGEFLDLGGRLALLAGVARLASLRGDHRDRTAVIDAVVVGVAVQVIVWIAIFRDYFNRGDVHVVERIITLSYLALDVALFAGLVLLLFRSHGGTPALRLLTVGIAVLVGADLVWLALEINGTYRVGHLLDVAWLIAYACIAASALHPSRGHLAPRLAVARRPAVPQALAFGAAIAVLPTVDFILRLLHVDLTLLDQVALGVGAVLVAVCVTARFFGLVQLTDELAAARVEQRTEALVRESQDVIAIIGPDRRATYVSPAIERVLGWTPEVAVGLLFETLVYPEDRAQVVEYFDNAVASGDTGSMTYEMRVTTSDGTGALMEIVAVNRLHDPHIAGFVLTARDITERRRLEEELAYQAFHDALTGLANRRLLLDHVTLAINNRRVEDTSAAVVVIDLDDFKAVNDSLGHTAGDDLLLAVAERLSRCVRPGDTVARLGGDEYALLLLDSEPGSLDAVAVRLLEILGLPLRAGGVEIAMSASIGVRLLRRTDTAQLAVRDADIAMYSAKTSGKAGYAIFDLEMGAQTERRLALKADLRGAWRRGEISVAFQPIVEIADGRLRGAEALMRWTHPLYGAVSPVEFIVLAEETGTILDLGLEVLREAAHHAARWRAKDAPTFYISVNVSPVQLEPGFVEAVDGILASTGLDPTALVLEVTEGVLLSDVDASVQILHSLRERGIRIAIDDFGTGYSSLSYAEQLPVDLVKIDRSFTCKLGSSELTLVPAVIQLAATLGAAVVAEGIETEEQASILYDLDCDLGQGHLYAPALPEATFRDLVRAGEVPVNSPLGTATERGRRGRAPETAPPGPQPTGAGAVRRR